MRSILAITNALADENRLRALLALERGELCACQITELLQLAPSTVSKHLSLLFAAGLVESRKQGRWIYYRLPDRPEAGAASALAWVKSALAGQERIESDARRLSEILACDPEEICKRQQARSKCCSFVRVTPVAARWPKAGRGRSRTT